MNEYVQKQKEYDRTKEWNDAGWDGTGVTVWNMEGLGAPENTASHGKKTQTRILDAAPGANVITKAHIMKCSWSDFEYEYVELDDGTKASADEFIRDNHVTILTQSREGKGDGQQSLVDLYSGLKNKYNLSLFNSAGNDGGYGVKGGALPQSLAMYIGAAIAYAHDFNNIQMAYYSSLGDEFEEVDFTHFVGPSEWNGTSFSSPYMAGIAALLQQRYGFDMTQEEMYAYFKMIARPIPAKHPSETEGYDYLSGWGMPILPHVDKRYVVMEIGRNTLKVDSAWMEMDTAPFIEKQRTFVPIAFAAEALGAQVYWDGEKRKVTILKGDKTVEMFIGSRSYLVNGKPFTMDVAPFIKNSRTFVPIAFAATALDCSVAWVANEKKVLILER